MKKIKVWITTGFANAKHEDEFDITEDWDEMNEKEQEDYLEECATDYRNNHIDFGAYVEED